VKDLRASVEEKLLSRGSFHNLLEGDNLKVNLLTADKQRNHKENFTHFLSRNNQGSTPFKYQTINED
jgi:hypothetical protein